jgi:uncharacterized coiled-coil protein SlyX
LKLPTVLFTVALLTGCAFASQSPTNKPQTITLEQRLAKTERQMADLAASHEKTMARLKQIQDQMDGLINSIRAAREKIAGKQTEKAAQRPPFHNVELMS